MESSINFNWDTSRVEAGERFSYFTDEICRAITQLEPELMGAASDFFAEIHHREQHGIAVTGLKCSSYISRRTSAGVSKSENHDFYMNFVTSGSLDAQQGDKRIQAKPGDVFLLDNARPFDLFLNQKQSVESCVVRLKRSDILEASTERLLNFEQFSNHHLFNLLKMSLVQLAQLSATSRHEEIHFLGRSVSRLIELVLADPNGDDCSRQHSRFWRNIESEIEKNIGDPYFGLNKLARNLQVSRRTIQNVFAARSTTFSRYLLNKRLSMGMNLLRLMDQNVSVETIAANCGFKDPTTFYRNFKKEFGVTPKGARHQIFGNTVSQISPDL